MQNNSKPEPSSSSGFSCDGASTWPTALTFCRLVAAFLRSFFAATFAIFASSPCATFMAKPGLLLVLPCASGATKVGRYVFPGGGGGGLYNRAALGAGFASRAGDSCVTASRATVGPATTVAATSAAAGGVDGGSNCAASDGALVAAHPPDSEDEDVSVELNSTMIGCDLLLPCTSARGDGMIPTAAALRRCGA